MKNIKLFLILLLSLTILSSCKSVEKKESPEEVTKAFITAFYTGDFNNMYKYTPSNNKVIIQQFEKSTSDADREKLKKRTIEFQEVKSKIQNDSVAECSCKFIFDGNPRETICYLRLEEGKWVVDLTIN